MGEQTKKALEVRKVINEAVIKLVDEAQKQAQIEAFESEVNKLLGIVNK